MRPTPFQILLAVSFPLSNCSLLHGPHFTYLLPPGWNVGGEGNYALVLRSADAMAGVIVFGQSGLLQPMSPPQFAHAMMAGTMRLTPDVQLGPARPFPPMPGYTHAVVFETSYTLSFLNGPVPCVAWCSAMWRMAVTNQPGEQHAAFAEYLFTGNTERSPASPQGFGKSHGKKATTLNPPCNAPPACPAFVAG